jgi:7-cyano-7-deazaguanine reductase
MYLQSYRNQGIFYENVVNKILDDFVATCQPVRAQLVGDFSARGGITTRVTVQFQKST